MEQLKHECGVAMIRLLKPIEYYKKKYGTCCYGLNLLYLMMEKQHNRGQEGAGVGVIKLNATPGNEYVFRERALGSGAITEIFGNIAARTKGADEKPVESAEAFTPFIGEIYMGHLRYSTTGKSGLSYVHPFLRRNNWRSRNLLLCGNFNMTNVGEIFDTIVKQGQHPRIYSDTVVLLEQLGYELDKENRRVYHNLRDRFEEPQLTYEIEKELDITEVLRSTAPQWDGGYVICGATGSGDMFALRDPNGIRPAFYYVDDEIVVVASERPVIQTCLNVARSQVKELTPGTALTVNKSGELSLSRIMDQGENKRCSFERIYFSRGSDADIYRERKALGHNLVNDIIEATGDDLSKVVMSFIPNTAEVAFIGLVEGFEKVLDRQKRDEILKLQADRQLDSETLTAIMKRKLRVEKIAIKDIKLRTFIAEGSSRNDLAAHVYDVTYGCIRNGEDKLVVIDDSIVRGTTLKQSILRMLDRLHPAEIIIVSSAPQVRYPDYYGIDMSRLGEFIAFRAAVALLKENGREDLLLEVYEQAKTQLKLKPTEQVNVVKAIYEPFTDREISAKIADMLTPEGTSAKVKIVYQSVDGLHKAIPDHPGDWYFTGDYPTPGGTVLVNRAYVNFFEGHADRR